MDKTEFKQALRRNGLTVEDFAILTGRSASQIYCWGSTFPVPYFARLLLRLLDERGGARGLLTYGRPGRPYAAVLCEPEEMPSKTANGDKK